VASRDPDLALLLASFESRGLSPHLRRRRLYRMHPGQLPLCCLECASLRSLLSASLGPHGSSTRSGCAGVCHLHRPGGGDAACAFPLRPVLTLRTPDGKLDPGVFLILFLPLVGFTALGLLTSLIVEFAIHDFILPHMALEGATFREAWRSARRAIAADKDAFVSWFILRLGVPLVAVTVMVIVALLPCAILFRVLENSAAGFNAMLEDSTGFLAVIRALLNVAFVALGLGVGSAIAAILGGPVGVFIRYQALCFYASRYPALGKIINAEEAD